MTLEKEILGDTTDVKSACCNFYEHALLRILLGDSLHPGGLALTKELGERLELTPEDNLLDIGSGLGTSAIYLGEEFQSNIIGIDLSQKNVKEANITAQQKGLDNVRFEVGDAERLPFYSEEFDVIISECSFCLFKSKYISAKEMYRVLAKNGRLGITDVAIEKELPFNTQSLILRVACIADALSINDYKLILQDTGFTVSSIINRKDEVLEAKTNIKKRIFVAELAQNLKKVDLGNINLKQVKIWLKEGKRLVNEGYGTYVMIIGSKK